MIKGKGLDGTYIYRRLYKWHMRSKIKIVFFSLVLKLALSNRRLLVIRRS